MNTQKGLAPVAIILAVVGILLVGSGAYYLAKNYKPKPAENPVNSENIQKNTQPEQPTSPTKPKEQPTSTATKQPSPTDETANWKTYRNEKYGFEVKYPDKIELKQKVDQGVKTITVKEFNNLVPPEVFAARIGTSDIPGLSLVRFSGKLKPSNFTDLATYLERKKISCQEAMKNSAAGGICSVTEVSLGSQKLPALVTLETSVRANTGIVIPIERGDKILEISYMYARYGNDSDDENIYNISQKILSTFRFIK